MKDALHMYSVELHPPYICNPFSPWKVSILISYTSWRGITVGKVRYKIEILMHGHIRYH